MKCFDCEGTGGKDDCWLCQGAPTITQRKASRNGYRLTDLQNTDPTDPYCDCPACDGYRCELCDGLGQVRPGALQREVTRVLVFGLTQRLPPSLELLPSGRVYDHDRLLSTGAASYCYKKKWSWRLNSVFGHELYLTRAGEAEARRRYAAWLAQLSEISFQHWLRWMEAGEPHRGYWSPPDVIEPERVAQWADDGGCHIGA